MNILQKTLWIFLEVLFIYNTYFSKLLLIHSLRVIKFRQYIYQLDYQIKVHYFLYQSQFDKFIIFDILLLKQKFMAFVFRGQKSSLFDNKKLDNFSNQNSTLNNQQSHLNGTSFNNSFCQKLDASLSKIVKGLPSLLGKEKYNLVEERTTQKQNLKFQDHKTTNSIKFNTEKLKKITENYFFSSKILRDPYNIPFKQINQNSTCQQFSPKPIIENQIKQKNQQILSSSNKIVNKNLLKTSYESLKNTNKITGKNSEKSIKLQKFLMDCSKQNTTQIKRKSSPPRLSEKKPNQLIKKIPPTKYMNQSLSQSTQSQIYMKTSFDNNNSLLKDRKVQKRIRKLKKGNLKSSFYKQNDTQQSSEQQNITPGPGAYENTVNLKQKKSFRSQRQKFAKIFVSPLQRFKSDQFKCNQITYVNEDKVQAKQKNQCFLSRTPKLQQIDKRSESPPPGLYNVRQSIQHDIVRNLLKSANVPNFSSTLPRFVYQKNNRTPGPGNYDIDCLTKAKYEELKNQASFSYKSNVKRCAQNIQQDHIREQNTKKYQAQLLTDANADKNVIHKRQQYFDSSEFFTAPPFLSGVQRFIQKDDDETQQNFISARLPQTNCLKKQLKNLTPFNSSSKRKLVQNVGDGVGVGSYLVSKDLLNKKSYNVYFH